MWRKIKDLELDDNSIYKYNTDCKRFFVDTDSELAIILKGLHEYYKENPSYMPPYAIELAMYTGMRVSKLSTLKWSDVDDVRISINKSAKHNRLKNEFTIGKTKTKKSRMYPVADQIKDLLVHIRRV